MQIQGIYAALATKSMNSAEAFYTRLFERDPDDRPMDGLIQWRNIAGANIQIFRDETNAGSGMLTIVVPKMERARQSLEEIGVNLTGELEGDYGRIAQIFDPDGNRITLAEPPSRPFATQRIAEINGTDHATISRGPRQWRDRGGPLGPSSRDRPRQPLSFVEPTAAITLDGEQGAEPQPCTNDWRIGRFDIHYHCRERPAGSIAAWLPHLMWREVTPLLASEFTVICADLRGYGAIACPSSAPDHLPYSKRAMAAEMVEVMAKLGFSEFMVAGHDRGGRVAYHMALDHPAVVTKLAVLDIIPTSAVWDRADDRFALAFWPWILLAQAAPLPERLITAAPEAVIDNALTGWGTSANVFPPEIREALLSRPEMQTGFTRSARNIVQQQASIVSMTGKTGSPGAAFVAQSWLSGAQPAPWQPGMLTRVDLWRYGGKWQTTLLVIRCPVAISFRRNIPRKRPTCWRHFSAVPRR